jgi:hypothetical protein
MELKNRRNTVSGIRIVAVLGSRVWLQQGAKELTRVWGLFPFLYFQTQHLEFVYLFFLIVVNNFLLLLLIYSHVHTLFGSFLHPAPLPQQYEFLTLGSYAL